VSRFESIEIDLGNTNGTNDGDGWQCIGSRNYLPFIVFLISTVLLAIYVIVFSIIHLVINHKKYSGTSTDAISRWDSVGSVIVIILSFAVVVPIGGLLGYHLRLMWMNRTTIEMVSRRVFCLVITLVHASDSEMSLVETQVDHQVNRRHLLARNSFRKLRITDV
jgi:hypothetical protein